MITIKALLNKIKWDKKENPEDYEIYCFDRILKKLFKLNLNEIEIKEGYIKLIKNNEEISIPLHRVKKVRKKGKIIWQR